MNIFRCVQKIYPGWQGVVWGNSYEGIKPHELETRPIPTLEELEKAWASMQDEIALEEILRKRKAEYPTTDELVVALWESIVEGRNEALASLQEKRLAVKKKYPKAEAADHPPKTAVLVADLGSKKCQLGASGPKPDHF